MATPIISSSSTSTSSTTKNKDVIESLFEDSKNTLKNEYDIMVVKIKEDLNKSKQQALSKLKKLWFFVFLDYLLTNFVTLTYLVLSISGILVLSLKFFLFLIDNKTRLIIIFSDL